MKNRLILGSIVFLLTLFARGIVFSAHAASLTYANVENVSLSSPSTTLTIATGSVADAFTVNATSVAVTMSSATGGDFTLISPTYDLSVTASAGGGSAPVSCSNGIHTVVLSQSTGSAVYTITPNGTTCSTSSAAPVIAVGGGTSAYDLSINGGAPTTATTSVTLSLYATEAYMMELSNTSSFASSTWVPYTTSYPWTLTSTMGEQTVFVQYRSISGLIIGNAQASIDLVPLASPVSTSTVSTGGMTIPQMQALILSLEAELQTLEAQAGSQASPTTTSFIFSRDLQSGMTGADVQQLQQVLISHNAGPAAEKLKAHGMTQYFGPLTRAALIEFQKSVGITPASGFFGPITRGWMKGHE
jgi:hypothetical protein